MNRENPYAAPEAELTPDQEVMDPEKVASIKHVIIFCVMYIAAMAAYGMSRGELGVRSADGGITLFGWSVLAGAIYGAVFTMRLAFLASGLGLAIIFFLLLLIPMAGLLMVLVINGRATTILKANGYEPRFLGAKKISKPD